MAGPGRTAPLTRMIVPNSLATMVAHVLIAWDTLHANALEARQVSTQKGSEQMEIILKQLAICDTEIYFFLHIGISQLKL